MKKSTILKAKEPYTKRVVIRTKAGKKEYVVTRHGVGILKTKHGMFYLFNFLINDTWQEYHVLVKANLNNRLMPEFANKKAISVRLDSGCLTGQLFFDKTCDCREQLHLAMEHIERKGEGIIICMPRQDGRGMGTPFKLTTLLLQELHGMDTVEAAEYVAGSKEIDKRDYYGAIAVLKFFNVPQRVELDLFTNNPKKLQAFIDNHYGVPHRMAITIKPTRFTRRHLLAKQTSLGHMELI